jgi:glucosamine-6-phosphate isomerase
MDIQVFRSYEELSNKAAEEIVSTIKLKPESVICLASGHSPQRTCEIFVQQVRQKKIDISRTTFIGLDEWMGISPEDPGSSQYFLKNNIINPLDLQKSNYHLFDVMAPNLVEECAKMDKVITQRGGIDLMVVGIGLNGHIGFNEPGVSLSLTCHVAELDETTKHVGQKYFSEEKTLKDGITLGLSHLMHAKKVLLLANGTNKAAIVAKALKGEVSNMVPASILQTHANSLILLDQDAASGLTAELLHS